MCWSGQASATLAVLGYTCAYFEYRKMRAYRQKWNDKYGLRTVVIFYYTLMEALQAVNYTVLDTPGFANSLCSLLGYLHICFQPFFISFLMLSLIPKKRREYWMKYVLFFSTISTIVLLSRFVISPSLPGCFAQHCTPMPSMDSLRNFSVFFTQTPGCSTTSFSSYFGDWHLAWKWALNNCGFGAYFYFFSMFTLPIFFGAYRAVIACFLLGPKTTIFLSTNADEFGTIWCLIAIALVSSIKIPAFERLLTVSYESWKETWQSTSQWMNQLQKNFDRNF